MTVGELFAGIGGMGLGLERAGFTVRWQVEIEPFCRAVLRKHWPHVAQYEDVRTVGGMNLESVDLICGGFPCQDISAAGKGAGIEGERSGLWREFARIIRELRPRWVLVENVPALRGRGADTVLGDLETAGYACWPLVVGARHVGAPHRRDRVWIVGHRDGLRRQAVGASVLESPKRDAPGHGVDRCDRAVDLANRDHAGLERRRMCGCERAHQWPTRPGDSPGEWEEPRTVEFPVGRAAHGVSARLASRRWRNELKALGNSVVPQVVEAIGAAILDLDPD